jgi:hypothetical protein
MSDSEVRSGSEAMESQILQKSEMMVMIEEK